MNTRITAILSAWVGFVGGIVTMLIVIAVVLSLSSCGAARRPSSPPALVVDMAPVQRLDSATLRNWLPNDLAGLPPYLVPAPAGSTPKQRRQWQKAQVQNLTRAGVQPAKIKNSSVATAPGATSINRPASAVATAAGSVATDARKAGQRGGASAVGPRAVATATSSHGPPWWVYLGVAVLGAIGWELLSAKVAPVRRLLRWRIS